MYSERELLQDIYHRLVDDYNGNEAFTQKEEDRYTLLHAIGVIDYRDDFITIFNDDEKCLLVFITDNGKSKVINYDDNFFYVEILLDTYLEMIEASFKGWKNKDLNESDYAEIKEQLGNYYKHLIRYADDLDLELANEQVRTLLGA